MTNSQQVCIPGIIGRLQPLPNTEFERKLIEKNVQLDARSNREYPVCLLVNATDTPDRTQIVLGASESCPSLLVKYGQLLHSMGAGFLVVTVMRAVYDSEWGIKATGALVSKQTIKNLFIQHR